MSLKKKQLKFKELGFKMTTSFSLSLTVNQFNAKKNSTPLLLKIQALRAADKWQYQDKSPGWGGETRLSLPACLLVPPTVTFLEAGWVGEDTRQQSVFVCIFMILVQPAVVVMVVASASLTGLPDQCGTGGSADLGCDPFLQ